MSTMQQLETLPVAPPPRPPGAVAVALDRLPLFGIVVAVWVGGTRHRQFALFDGEAQPQRYRGSWTWPGGATDRVDLWRYDRAGAGVLLGSMRVPITDCSAPEVLVVDATWQRGRLAVNLSNPVSRRSTSWGV